MGVIELAMRRSRTVVLCLLVVLVGGMVAYTTIPKEAEPDIEIPIIYVSIEHDGISPEDAERLRAAGFAHAAVWLRYFNFVSIIAIR